MGSGDTCGESTFSTDCSAVSITSQLVQRGGGEHGANEETVGDENAVDLAQRAQDVVRPVQVERGKDDVGAVVLEREEFLVDLHICGFNYGSVFIKALLLELD